MKASDRSLANSACDSGVTISLSATGSGSHGPKYVARCVFAARSRSIASRVTIVVSHASVERSAERVLLVPAQPRVLQDVFGIRPAAQHSIGDAEQPRAVAGEDLGVCGYTALILRSWQL